MSSWDKIIKRFEQNPRRSSRPGAIKFLKTNPSRHQVLAYTKKIVDRIARDTDVLLKEKNTSAWYELMYQDSIEALGEELEDALTIADHSRKFLGISYSYLYKVDDLIDLVDEVVKDGDFYQSTIRDLKSGLKKFYTQHKRAMIKPNRNSVSTDVVNEAKKMKIRLTKNVNGKRVRRTEAELRKLIANKKK
jgi:hypothetical protein